MKRLVVCWLNMLKVALIPPGTTALTSEVFADRHWIERPECGSYSVLKMERTLEVEFMDCDFQARPLSCGAVKYDYRVHKRAYSTSTRTCIFTTTNAVSSHASQILASVVL